MKPKLITVLLACAALTYGILIGKYEVFPFKLLKHIQDSIFETKMEIAATPIAINLSQYDKNLLEKLTTVNSNNFDSCRRVLQKLIFGSSDTITRLPETISKITDSEYSDLANLKNLEQFTITQDYDIRSIGYIFHPINSNKELVIYHEGHDGDFVHGKETIRKLLANGYTVYALCMPLLGKNNKPNVFIKKMGELQLLNHEKLKFLSNPIRFFAEPVIVAINLAEASGFEKIYMVGISGGGWTTTLIAALDARIDKSFPVAGSYPMFARFVRQDKNYGDFEQTYPDLYSQINYLDMYILGAIGEGRLQMQLLNKYDRCCYDGDEYKIYEDHIKSRVKACGKGDFTVFSDSSHSEHIISEVAINAILKSIATK